MVDNTPICEIDRSLRWGKALTATISRTIRGYTKSHRIAPFLHACLIAGGPDVICDMPRAELAELTGFSEKAISGLLISEIGRIFFSFRNETPNGAGRPRELVTMR